MNRLSIGVQSFEPRELRVLGRRHTAADVANAVRAARAAGFANVSVDLIFGVPGQTEESWAASLDAAVALDVEHVSCYGLTIEEGTPYATWFARDPSAFAGRVARSAHVRDRDRPPARRGVRAVRDLELGQARVPLPAQRALLGQ